MKGPHAMCAVDVSATGLAELLSKFIFEHFKPEWARIAMLMVQTSSPKVADIFGDVESLGTFVSLRSRYTCRAFLELCDADGVLNNKDKHTLPVTAVEKGMQCNFIFDGQSVDPSHFD
eukprot:1812747-Karenia_brevis.AAC.1